MSWAVAFVGWAVAGALAVVVARLWRRLELVARAEHELRGPLTAFGLALDAARGTPAGRRLGVVLEAELARARAGLADLAAARAYGRRAEPVHERVRVDRLLRSSAAAWRVPVRGGVERAVVRGDRARLAQALGNVMSNAVEHGGGEVSVRARRVRSRLRIEVENSVRQPDDGARDPSRGRGLSIAAEAAADAGGTVSAVVGSRRAIAVLELPVEDG